MLKIRCENEKSPEIGVKVSKKSPNSMEKINIIRKNLLINEKELKIFTLNSKKKELCKENI